MKALAQIAYGGPPGFPGPDPRTNFQSLTVIALALALALIAGGTSGCAARKPVRLPENFHGRIIVDRRHCHYLADGIRFTCKDPVFDPDTIDATKAKANSK